VITTLTGAAALVALAADLALLVASWKSRTALAGVLGATSVALVVVGLANSGRRRTSEYSLAAAGLTLIIGTALYALGQALERILENPEDS
jgi:hypothetical protein